MQKDGDLKFIMYVRKSTDRGDNQIESLPDQIKVLNRLAKERGLNVVDIIRESKSAKKPYCRPAFASMVSKIQNGDANAIICWKLDRLARNPIDGGSISWLLQEGTISKIVTPQKDYYSTDNVLMMSVELGMANQYSLDLSSNVSRSVLSKFERGQYPSMPPLGFSNFRESKKSAYIISDPERFDLVKRMWRKMLTGRYNPRQICDMANVWGLRTRPRANGPSKKIDYSTVYKMFANPFYAGILEYKGNRYKAAHEAMVTIDEFKRVQELISGKTKTRTKTKEFPFTGSIRCSECGCLVVAEEKHKLIKSTGKEKNYVYYHCSGRKKDYNCSQRSSAKASELEEQILAELDKSQIYPEFYNFAKKVIKRENEEHFDEKEKITASLHKTVANCDSKLERLLDARIEGLIESEQYLAKKNIIDNEKNQALEQLENADKVIQDWTAQLDRAIDFVAYAKEAFIAGDNGTKREILRNLSQNLTLENGILSVGDEYWRKPIKDMLIQIKQKNARLEPAFSMSQTAQRHISEEEKSLWWTRQDSNLRHPHCK